MGERWPSAASGFGSAVRDGRLAVPSVVGLSVGGPATPASGWKAAASSGAVAASTGQARDILPSVMRTVLVPLAAVCLLALAFAGGWVARGQTEPVQVRCWGLPPERVAQQGRVRHAVVYIDASGLSCMHPPRQ